MPKTSRPRTGRTAPLFVLSLLALACGAASERPETLAGEASVPNGGVSAESEMRIGAPTIRESGPPPTTPTGPVSWEEAPTLRFTRGPFAGCALKRFDSGWIVGRCGELEVFVQAGFAAATGPITQRGVAGDRVGGRVHPRRVIVAGRSSPGAELVVRQAQQVETLIGPDARPDPNGRILGRGLHARIRTPESGAVGATCHADVGDWDERACVRFFETLARHDLPAGPRPERSLTVAGVGLDFSGERCWSPEPGEVYCFLDGGLRFARGSADRMAALREESIRRAPLAPRSEAERQASADRLNANRERIHMLTMVSELERTGRVSTTEAPTFDADDFPRMRVERSEHTCRVGGVESACTRVDYYGALDHVAEYAYYARVPTGDGEETLVHCRHGHEEPAPNPCRQVFGSFVVSPR